MLATDDRLWTVREAAEYLGYSTKYAYELVSLGRLPHIDLEGTIRFRPSALRAWVAAHEKPGKISKQALKRYFADPVSRNGSGG